MIFSDIYKIDAHIDRFLKSSLGSKQKQELLIRHFFRMICSTSIDLDDTLKEKIFWLTKTLKSYNPTEVAKLLLVTFGPLISINNSFHSLPYIAWWDLTDSHFVENGLGDLGLTFSILYRNYTESIWNKECKKTFSCINILIILFFLRRHTSFIWENY